MHKKFLESIRITSQPWVLSITKYHYNLNTEVVDLVMLRFRAFSPTTKPCNIVVLVDVGV